ncbi:MAG: hypothetical protein JXC31_05640 [Acholeplasmataceae bacterium]|nr:hypothetical protein [Acholeplasmataceae bacterium]
MKDIIKSFDNLPWIVKLILALPGIDIVWGIYRLIKGLDKNNGLLVLAGIIWIFTGWAILWIIDLYTVIMHNKITVLAN